MRNYGASRAVGRLYVCTGYMSVRETNDPALHEFPAALQAGLGWSKARGYTRKVYREWSPVRRFQSHRACLRQLLQ